ncbi:hypothetical protein [Manganibacter manganicus]|uniref:Uncharacterized protein n=1 Tax=Manganibacter manganicus TaxID=1873176 RepID=A0A1V8RQW7_9HYPH|nr:hypothetical protein [Pseudaminobacter manganicus]OQM75602.1 hypothetical protein BFN67_17675 [Pseudaminobacter manganicus]
MANRVLLGNFNGDYKVRISRPGFDVMDANLNNNQLSFTSDSPEIGRIVQRGMINLVPAGYDDISDVTVNFGVTYAEIPIVLAFVNNNGKYLCINTLTSDWQDNGWPDCGVIVTTTSCTFTVHYGGSKPVSYFVIGNTI